MDFGLVYLGLFNPVSIQTRILLRYRIYLNILRYILLINKDPEYVILLKMQLW